MAIAGLPKQKRHRVHGSDGVFYTVITVLVVLWIVIVLYPLIYTISSSFSSGAAVSSGQVFLWPVEPSILGYQYVLKYRQVWVGYGNTLLYTIVGSIITVIYCIMAAYPLSRRNFQGRRFIMTLFTITMFFGGGLIPSYILNSQLGLVNTRWHMFVHSAAGMGNILIMRTFFRANVPDELLESAKLDGITDFGYLIKIVLPLSKAVISVISLYAVVGHWNAYFGPLIYLMDRDLQPLQIVLQEILLASRFEASELADPELAVGMANLADSMKFSLIVVSTVPMLVLYPFVQKFFEKGVMMGSIKG
ncbi:MAG: carbohydrate ABC transporter permease [Lachnospiraceae bacterium]|nr:carbohydrate ABC transporter permease [Lachnospiraceae bacterium]